MTGCTTTDELLKYLGENDCIVALDGNGNLALDLPEELANEALVAAIRNCKAEIVEVLAQRDRLPVDKADGGLATADACLDPVEIALADWFDPANWHESFEIRDGQRWRVLVHLDYVAERVGTMEVGPGVLDAIEGNVSMGRSDR